MCDAHNKENTILSIKYTLMEHTLRPVINNKGQAQLTNVGAYS
jgi:hypothetical protein